MNVFMPYWIASIVGGLTWGLIGAASINVLMEKVPQDDRPAYMALHNLVLSLGILAGSLSGPLVAELVGLQIALILAAVLRLIAAVFLLYFA